MIKAVLFDVDGVLLDSFEANLKFYQDMMNMAGYPPPTREDFPSLFHLSMRSAIEVLVSGTKEERERVFEMGMSRTVKYPVDLLTMPAHAKEVVGELSRIYTLGIVTSRIKNSVFEAPKLAGLRRYFSVVVCYEDTIAHKPHPEPLLLAARRLDILPSEAVYVGDAGTDLEAAKAAGMRVLMYSKEKFAKADASTSSFKEIPSIISRW